MAGDYRGDKVAEVTILFLALSWVTVSLRVYVRAIMTKSFGIDDWLAVLSLALFTFYCAFVLDGVHYGTGRHLTEIHNFENLIIAIKAWWIAEIGYVSTTTVLKLSIGFFLLRVCVKRFQRNIIYAVLGVVTLYSVGYFLLIIFQCRPTSFFWNKYDFFHPMKGKCVGPSVIAGSTYTHSALSAIADWTLGILPIFLVWDLNMNPRTKVSVAVILALGALGSTATLVRIPYIHQLTESTDFLFVNVDVSIWSTVEPGIGITASAMATLRPLFVNFFSRSRLLGSSTREASSAWGPRSTNRKGYFRSGGNDNNSPEELGLSGLPKGSGVSTTIHSMNDIRSSEERAELEQKQAEKDGPSPKENVVDDTIKRIRRFGSGRREDHNRSVSGKALKGASGTWNSNESRLTEDSSSEEGITAHGEASNRRIEVTKTTEVTTTSEWRGPRSRAPNGIGIAVSRDSLQ